MNNQDGFRLNLDLRKHSFEFGDDLAWVIYNLMSSTEYLNDLPYH